ncbi:MAG: hypothetical protein AAFP84_21970 [Actinomycetota bacterium]
MSATELVDISIPLTEIWTHHVLGADERANAEAEITSLLAGDVDDPETVAAATMEEFVERIGGGSIPMLVASFREEMDDGSIFAASLVVTKNELSGSLEPWSEAYGDDAVGVDVAGAPALRIDERSRVAAGALFDEPVEILTWRFVVPFDARSVLMFAFSSPNHDLADILLEHVEEIMSGVEIAGSESSTSGGD